MYTFVRNNPLSRFDVYGLQDAPTFPEPKRKGPPDWVNRLGILTINAKCYKDSFKKADQDYQDCLEGCQGHKDSDEREDCTDNCFLIYRLTVDINATKYLIRSLTVWANLFLDGEINY